MGNLVCRNAPREPARNRHLTRSPLDPGTLPGLASHLHQRTADRIGSLARLIREAALTAILDGTERITRQPG